MLHKIRKYPLIFNLYSIDEAFLLVKVVGTMMGLPCLFGCGRGAEISEDLEADRGVTAGA